MLNKSPKQAIRFYLEEEKDLENQETKPILDDNGSDTGYVVTEYCKLIDTRSGKELTTYSGNSHRPFGRISMNGENRMHSMTRIAKRAFDNEFHTIDYYDNLVIDHNNPSVPLDNHISNLEWVDSGTNRRRAEQLNMVNHKNRKEAVHEICQLICEGYSRQEIVELIPDINVNLIDDIRAGRSHKDVSSQYLDKGFTYRHFDRDEKEALVRQVCELLQERKYTPREITEMLGLTNKCFVNDILHKRVYTKISKEYNF